MSDIEEVEEVELRKRYDRGDYVDLNEKLKVERLLRKFKKERDYLKACEKASITSALTATKQAKASIAIALLSLLIALLSLLWQIFGHLG